MAKKTRASRPGKQERARLRGNPVESPTEQRGSPGSQQRGSPAAGEGALVRLLTSDPQHLRQHSRDITQILRFHDEYGTAIFGADEIRDLVRTTAEMAAFASRGLCKVDREQEDGTMKTEFVELPNPARAFASLMRLMTVLATLEQRDRPNTMEHTLRTPPVDPVAEALETERILIEECKLRGLTLPFSVEESTPP